MSKYQWRILINDNPGPLGPHTETYPAQQWPEMVQRAENRGMKVTLERRLVWYADDTEAAADILPTLDPASYTKLPNGTTIFAWEKFAEYDDRNPMKIAAMIGGEEN